MQCYLCGAPTYETLFPLVFRSLLLGEITLTPLPVTKCESCDVPCILSAPTASESSRQIAVAEQQAILNLPVSKLITSTDAAEMLGISKRELSVHKRIKRGFIIHIDLGDCKLYYQPSVEAFRETGDGRILIIGDLSC